MSIRHAISADANQICEIYNHYIANTVITFEEEFISPEAMAARIESYTKIYPWLVCEVDNKIVGYAYATKWRERAAYRHSVEITVYVKNSLGGRGYGKALYAELLGRLEAMGCHLLLAGIALPNEASIGLHESFGFTKAAHFSEVGFKFGQWVDVGYWQKKIAAC